MSKFQRLRAESEILKFETESGKIQVTINPLTNRELTEVAELFEKNVMSPKGTAKVMMMTLRKDDPTITEEEIAEFPAPVFVEIMSSVLRVNKLDKFVDSSKKKLDSDPVALRLQQIQSLRESTKETQ